MIELIKLNNYTPPSPSGYEISYSDVNGEESMVEDGTTYIEQIRSDVPEIKIAWTNLTQEETTMILNEVSEDLTDVMYFFGTIKQCKMTSSGRSLKLKSIDENGNTFWDLSFTLKG